MGVKEKNMDIVNASGDEVSAEMELCPHDGHRTYRMYVQTNLADLLTKIVKGQHHWDLCWYIFHWGRWVEIESWLVENVRLGIWRSMTYNWLWWLAPLLVDHPTTHIQQEPKHKQSGWVLPCFWVAGMYFLSPIGNTITNRQGPSESKRVAVDVLWIFLSHHANKTKWQMVHLSSIF